MTEPERVVDRHHNQPPSDLVIYADEAKEKHRALFKRFAGLIEDEASCPAVIEDDVASGKRGDYIKRVTDCGKELEVIRVGDKMPLLNATRIIDSFFGGYIEKLDALRKRLAPAQVIYLEKKKADAERKKRDEAERLRKESAEKLAEAQRKEKVAQEALAVQLRESARVAAEAAAAQKVRDDAAAAVIKSKQDEIDRLNKAAEDTAVDNAYELAAAEEALRSTERSTRDASRAGRQVDRSAKAGVELLEDEAAASKKESGEALDAAVALDRQAQRMERAARDPAASNVRTRGEEGSVSGLRTTWRGEIKNLDSLDLDALRHHLTLDALNAAIAAFVLKGGRKLDGADIFEDTNVQVR